ncbi:MAG: hypothetical protein M3Y71_04660 [Actinomycetota bacterium]|nr:hypothetical protein [Actinomycetota bacterium]
MSAPAQNFPGASSIHSAVDQYVKALRTGSGADLSRILDVGFGDAARSAEIAKVDGHPVAVVSTTLYATPSDLWKTMIVQINDAGTVSTQQVMVGPPADSKLDEAPRWKISLIGPPWKASPDPQSGVTARSSGGGAK